MPQTRDENLLLIHPHAQRTGGKTIRNALVSAYGEGRVYSGVFLPKAKRWRWLTEAELAPYRAYSDLYNYVDIKFSRPSVAIGLVRDPVERAVSIYRYVRRHESHRHHALAMRVGLEEFYPRASAQDPSYFRNLQCRRICGHADATLALKIIPSRYIGVGLTSHLDEFVEALGAVFRWPAPKRRTKARASYEAEITPAFRRMVLAENAEDMELYETMAAGPLYGAARRSPARRVKTLATRARDFTLTVARKLV